MFGVVDDWGDDGVEIMVEDVDEGGDVEDFNADASDGIVAADFDFDIVDGDDNDESFVAVVVDDIVVDDDNDGDAPPTIPNKFNVKGESFERRFDDNDIDDDDPVAAVAAATTNDDDDDDDDDDDA